MKGNNVLKEDRAASTIHIINGLIRGFTHQKQAKKVDTDYFVFADDKIDEIVDISQNKAAKDAIVIDDLGLQIVDRLYHKGLKHITLILARLPKELFHFISDLIKRTFPNIKIDIKHIEEVDHMKTDLLISNPAYGAIGANITDTLRQKIDYKEFINLLPANDYKRNKTKDLFKYQSDMMPISNGFTDAAVTTHVARIHKGTVDDPAPNINMTLDEFERSQYIDRQLDKYFEENSKRSHYAIDNSCGWITETASPNISYTILFDHRCVPHKHFAYSKKTAEYHWNILKDITMVDMLTSAGKQALLERKLNKDCITFSSDLEKNNFAMFMYSDNGFRFYAKILSALNKDSTEVLSKWVPKVDWTRSWTVEEILKDYGYTEEDIAKVMADLDHFKGMDD